MQDVGVSARHRYYGGCLVDPFGGIRLEPIGQPGQGSIGEETVGIDWRATNIYRREAGGWKIVHYHTDFSKEVAEALGL
jgi:hypothetical protein